MKFRDKRSGLIYAPSNEQVACWMAKDPNLEPIVKPEKAAPKKAEKAAPKKPTRKSKRKTE